MFEGSGLRGCEPPDEQPSYQDNEQGEQAWQMPAHAAIRWISMAFVPPNCPLTAQDTSADQGDRRTVRIVRAVKNVQESHIHPTIDQPFKYRRLGAGLTDRAHKFGFSHEGGITGKQAIISWNTQSAPSPHYS